MEKPENVSVTNMQKSKKSGRGQIFFPDIVSLWLEPFEDNPNKKAKHSGNV